MLAGVWALCIPGGLLYKGSLAVSWEAEPWKRLYNDRVLHNDRGGLMIGPFYLYFWPRSNRLLISTLALRRSLASDETIPILCPRWVKAFLLTLLIKRALKVIINYLSVAFSVYVSLRVPTYSCS